MYNKNWESIFIQNTEKRMFKGNGICRTLFCVYELLTLQRTNNLNSLFTTSFPSTSSTNLKKGECFEGYNKHEYYSFWANGDNTLGQ